MEHCERASERASAASHAGFIYKHVRTCPTRISRLSSDAICRYNMFEAWPLTLDTAQSVDDIMSTYFKRLSMVNYTIDGRLINCNETQEAGLSAVAELCSAPRRSSPTPAPSGSVALFPPPPMPSPPPINPWDGSGVPQDLRTSFVNDDEDVPWDDHE